MSSLAWDRGKGFQAAVDSSEGPAPQLVNTESPGFIWEKKAFLCLYRDPCWVGTCMDRIRSHLIASLMDARMFVVPNTRNFLSTLELSTKHSLVSSAAMMMKHI